MDCWDVCSDCKEMQSVDVTFNAVHPISTVKHTIEYCKHLDLILNDDIKHAIGKVECRFTKSEES